MAIRVSLLSVFLSLLSACDSHPPSHQQRQDATQELAAALAANNVEAVKTALARGGDPGAEHDEDTLLAVAARHASPEVFEQLLTAPYARERSHLGEPLVAAAAQGTLDTVQLLLRAGAPVDTRIKGGISALLIASYRGDPDIVDRLLGAGAPVDLPNNDKETAMMVCMKRCDEIVPRLLNVGFG